MYVQKAHLWDGPMDSWSLQYLRLLKRQQLQQQLQQQVPRRRLRHASLPTEQLLQLQLVQQLL